MSIKYNRDKFSNALLSISRGETIDKKIIAKAHKLGAKICKVNKVKLCTNNTTKIIKSNKLGVDFSIIMHLAPSNLSGYNVCPMASAGCIKACLNTSGRGRYDNIQQSRIKKTKFFFEHRELFGIILYSELKMWRNRARKKRMKLAVRLNGTSDIQWEKIFPWLFGEFQNVTFYDYTKIAKRFDSPLPSNYVLTFSRSEVNERQSLKILNNGNNVAVVFSNLTKALEEGYKGFPVIDGVSTDRRFADAERTIVGLKALARARHDKSGFVVRN